MKPFQSVLRPLGCFAMACAFAMLSGSPRAVEPVAVAVIDFDYVDTSGEVMNQTEAHAARLRDLARHIREGLERSGRYRVVQLACDPTPCSAGRTDPAELLAKAREGGARLLLYGGIQKMSTLIQYGNAQVVDLDADRLVFDRNISFRGDDDAAWDRAAKFLVGEVVKENLAQQGFSATTLPTLSSQGLALGEFALGYFLNSPPVALFTALTIFALNASIS